MLLAATMSYLRACGLHARFKTAPYPGSLAASKSLVELLQARSMQMTRAHFSPRSAGLSVVRKNSLISNTLPTCSMGMRALVTLRHRAPRKSFKRVAALSVRRSSYAFKRTERGMKFPMQSCVAACTVS